MNTMSMIKPSDETISDYMPAEHNILKICIYFCNSLLKRNTSTHNSDDDDDTPSYSTMRVNNRQWSVYNPVFPVCTKLVHLRTVLIHSMIFKAAVLQQMASYNTQNVSVWAYRYSSLPSMAAATPFPEWQFVQCAAKANGNENNYYFIAIIFNFQEVSLCWIHPTTSAKIST